MKSTLNTNIQLVLLALATLCVSCDKKEEAIKKFNVSPRIDIVTSDADNVPILSKSKVDSLRLSDLVITTKKIKIRYADRNKNIASMKVYSSSSYATLKHHGRVIKDFLPIDQDMIELDFENQKEELTTLEFTITDKLGAADKVTYNILTFKNLAPIAVLNIHPETEQKYRIDASRSYDEDKNYNGKIEWYIFSIDGNEIKSRKAIQTHHFNEKGTYKIELKTIDNQKLMSNPSYKTIVIN